MGTNNHITIFNKCWSVSTAHIKKDNSILNLGAICPCKSVTKVYDNGVKLMGNLNVLD